MTSNDLASSNPSVGSQMGRPTTFSRVLRSEWIKTRSLRSTWITVASVLIVIVAFGSLSAMVASGSVDPGPGGEGGPGVTRRSPLAIVITGANLAVLIVAVMGSVAGAREFSTGMIRTTFSAVPRRLPALWAKLLTFTAVVLPVVVVGIIAVFFLGMSILDAGGVNTVTWGDDGVARSLLGNAYYVVGLGIIGLAIGLLLRSTAASIGIVLGAVIFLPALATALLPDSWDVVLKYLPSNAGTAFTMSGDSMGVLLSPASGALAFTAWIVVAIVGAAVVLKRRDA